MFRVFRKLKEVEGYVYIFIWIDLNRFLITRANNIWFFISILSKKERIKNVQKKWDTECTYKRIEYNTRQLFSRIFFIYLHEILNER